MVRKVAQEYFIKTRKDNGFTQRQFADFLNLSPRTVTTIESGGNVSDETYSIVEQSFLKAKFKGQMTDENKIKKMLDGDKPINSSKDIGVIEAQDPIEEIYNIEELGPGEASHLYIVDPLDQNAKKRPPKESDYIHVTQFASPLRLESNDYKKLIDDEPSIFIPTFNYSSSSTNNAIKNLSEAIENFDGQTKASFTKLSEVSESLAQKETIMQRIAELNDAGLNIFIGEQHLHHSTVKIFLIDDFNIPNIRYIVKAVHPKFMKKKIPYYSFFENPHVMPIPLLEKKPVQFTKGGFVEIFYTEDAEGYEDYDIWWYGQGKADQTWINLSDSIKKTFTPQEFTDFSNYNLEMGFKVSTDNYGRAY